MPVDSVRRELDELRSSSGADVFLIPGAGQAGAEVTIVFRVHPERGNLGARAELIDRRANALGGADSFCPDRASAAGEVDHRHDTRRIETREGKGAEPTGGVPNDDDAAAVDERLLGH